MVWNNSTTHQVNIDTNFIHRKYKPKIYFSLFGHDGKFTSFKQWYKKALLCYNICWSILTSQFLSDTIFILRISIFILLYLCDVFHRAVNVPVQAPIYCLWFVAKDSESTMRDQGGEGGVMQVVICFVRVRARNYSGTWITVLERVPIPGPSTVTSTAGYRRDNICRPYMGTTSRPQLKSGRWPSYVRVKGVPRIFMPRVDSNLWVQRVPPSWQFDPLIGPFCHT